MRGLVFAKIGDQLREEVEVLTMAEPAFAPFDLVELTEPVADHDVGARGTVIIAGPDKHASVDFAWSDEYEPDRHDAVDVPERSLRVVERRRGQRMPGKPRR